jgi:pyridoxal phosphate enzyme (YggS family)
MSLRGDGLCRRSNHLAKQGIASGNPERASGQANKSTLAMTCHVQGKIILMNELKKSIREKHLRTLDKIASAARTAGRDPQSVKLVVVTKSQPLEVAQAAIEAGVQFLGENYPEEGVMKIQSLAEHSAVEWHMIGHVQSRKAELVAQNFNLMHSLDSLKLATRLDRFCGEAGRTLPVLLEFNVGGEESKGGWPARDETHWPVLLSDVNALLALPHLQVRGLMTMPPLGENAEFSRLFFQRLRRLQEYLVTHFPQANWKELSMGTSADFEVAVQEGATLVRVGTAIIGARQYNKLEAS